MRKAEYGDRQDACATDTAAPFPNLLGQPGKSNRMRGHLVNRFWTQLAVGILLIFCCSCQTGRYVRISPRLSEDQIRAEILKYTPIGSTETEVMSFARTRLKRHEGVAPAQDSPDEIVAFLGRYGFIFIGSYDTHVQWKFNSDHKLIRVEVIKGRDVL